jgi:ketosteroid isomerase-like protein
MEDANVAVVKAGFEAWHERGSEFIEEFLAPDIEWEVRPDLPDAALYKGHDGVRDVLARFNEVIDDMWIEPQELIPVGQNQVVVPLRWAGAARAATCPLRRATRPGSSRSAPARSRGSRSTPRARRPWPPCRARTNV